jgi:ActR/RegA family two-component response regulator
MNLTHDLLLVEDDLLLARSLQRALLARGIQARHVARCATASALRGPFHVGVFDLDLPDGDGVELAQRLIVAGIVQRAIFYTACAHPARLAGASAIGAVFAKSKQLGSLMDTLTPALTPARGSREACVSAPLQ